MTSQWLRKIAVAVSWIWTETSFLFRLSSFIKYNCSSHLQNTSVTSYCWQKISRLIWHFLTHNCPRFVKENRTCSKQNWNWQNNGHASKDKFMQFLWDKEITYISISNNLDSFISINIYINLENQCNCKNSRPPNFYSFCTIT